MSNDPLPLPFAGPLMLPAPPWSRRTTVRQMGKHRHGKQMGRTKPLTVRTRFGADRKAPWQLKVPAA